MEFPIFAEPEARREFRCFYNSRAHRYAESYQIPFVLLDEMTLYIDYSAAGTGSWNR